jgi:hypothetical protein
MGNVDAHLRQAAKQMGVPVEEVAPRSHDCPSEALHLWLYFTELHNARASGGFGPSPITFESIRAWCDLTGIYLLPWEVKAVKEIDRVFLEITNARLSAAQPRHQQRAGTEGE